MGKYDELFPSAGTTTGGGGPGGGGPPFASYRVQENSVDSTLVYYGLAFPENATTSSAIWRIYRADITDVYNAVFTYADGDTANDNIWDNRESLSYSAVA
jgi:hypothetical protein